MEVLYTFDEGDVSTVIYSIPTLYAVFNEGFPVGLSITRDRRKKQVRSIFSTREDAEGLAGMLNERLGVDSFYAALLLGEACFLEDYPEN